MNGSREMTVERGSAIIVVHEVQVLGCEHVRWVRAQQGSHACKRSDPPIKGVGAGCSTNASELERGFATPSKADHALNAMAVYPWSEHPVQRHNPKLSDSDDVIVFDALSSNRVACAHSCRQRLHFD